MVLKYARHSNIGVPKSFTHFTHANLKLALGSERNDGSDVDFPDELSAIVDFKGKALFQSNSGPLLPETGC